MPRLDRHPSEGDGKIGHGARDERGGEERSPAEHGSPPVLKLPQLHLLLRLLGLRPLLEGVVKGCRLAGLLVFPLGCLDNAARTNDLCPGLRRSLEQGVDAVR